MTNKAALSLLAAAVLLTSCAGPDSSGRSAARPAAGRDTTASTSAPAPAPADPGGRWLGGDADRVWDGSGGTGSSGAAEKSASTAGRSGAPVPAAAAAPASASAGAGAAVGRPGVPPGAGDVIAPPTRQGPGLRAGSRPTSGWG